jgi:hypothetical protein
MGALDEPAEQLASDAMPLPGVDDDACEFGDIIPCRRNAIACHADDRLVGRVDREERLPRDVVDVGESCEIAVG